MLKKQILILTIALSCLFAQATKAQEVLQDVQGNAVKFGRMLRLIENYYVDTTNIEKLTENAIIHMLADLDPHSMYISAEEVDKMNEPLEGIFEGIGISFNILHDTLMVVQAIPGGPSEKVGLMAGDRIVKIDTENVAGTGIQNSDVMKKLRGDKGTKVKLEVLRSREKSPLLFTIVRDKIPIYSMDASYMLDEQIGYIKLNRFAKTTADEINDAIKELEKTPSFSSLILDLRGNGGGYLSMAIELADQFLPAGKLVVYTDGVHSARKDYDTYRNKQLEDYKLVILIDEGSASAAEIVSGAIQDWDRGVIIGRRSFGKGLVQQPFPLTDGSIVRLTTSHYYTPSGRCIQKPYDKGSEAYEMDYYNRYMQGELFNADSIHLNKSKVFETLDTHRKVYAGGGIMPDIFMPLDTNVNYSFYNQLLHKNLVYESVLDYQDKHRKSLMHKYPNFAEYQANFNVEDKFVEKIITEGKAEGLEADEEAIAFARPLLKKITKAIMARSLYSESCYYQVMNSKDEQIEKAMQVLKDDKTYRSILQGER
ncbi:MAG: S41 family peptidase [Mangrovibacterium sp.]